MRRVRYQVAMSLDGFIAGPNGEADWIVNEPAIDFAALFAQFDTAIMGRKTYEAMRALGSDELPGMRSYVFSRTLRAEEHPKVTVVRDDLVATVTALRNGTGKDIWLFGGGELARQLLAARLVDTVELAVMPVLLGQGIALLNAMRERTALKLTAHTAYPSGIVMLEYAVA